MGVWAVEGQSSKQMKTFEGGLWWDEKEGGGKGYGPRYAFFLYYLNYHKDNKKKFWLSRAEVKQQSKVQRLRACHTKFSLPICFLYILAIILSLIRPHIPSISHKPAS